MEFNRQKNISLLQLGRHFFVYSSNMAAVTSCEHTLLIYEATAWKSKQDDFDNWDKSRIN